MQVVQASGTTVNSALARARELLGLKLKDSREVVRSGGEDGLYRCHLASGDVVEVTCLGRGSVSIAWVN